jgi:hypothetical protein
LGRLLRDARLSRLAWDPRILNLELLRSPLDSSYEIGSAGKEPITILEACFSYQLAVELGSVTTLQIPYMTTVAPAFDRKMGTRHKVVAQGHVGLLSTSNADRLAHISFYPPALSWA